jgi:hypothetical protein
MLALHAIQTALLDAHRVVQVGPRVLHNVRHLLEQDSVFPLNLRIASCTMETQTPN